MHSRWRDADADAFLARAGADPADRDLALRVYTSRLVGGDPDLVLHGGGNTSVKTRRTVEGETRRVIHVKGSGWDLGTIEGPGLPAVTLDPLLDARDGPKLSDPEMVRLLRAHLLDANAPNPSVETLLHAFLPHAFVDHTHATAALVLANQPNAADIAREVYGTRIGIVPYVMPGWDLSLEGARVYDADPAVEGLFLVNHGLFTFDDDARRSYERMIDFVTAAETHLASAGVTLAPPEAEEAPDPALSRVAAALLEALRRRPGPFAEGAALDLRVTPSLRAYAAHPDLDEIAHRGTVTPDHVIRLKPFPLILSPDADAPAIETALDAFAERYIAYFRRHAARAEEEKTMLDPLPRIALVRGLGAIGIGRKDADAAVCGDLAEQTARTVLAAEAYGRFTPIAEADLFDMEYWSLEQAKLARK